MRNRTLADLDRVVALGGGHGLGRVLSSLSSLGSRLTGIVTTTDNGVNWPYSPLGRRDRTGRYAQLSESVNYRTQRRIRYV